MHFAHYGVIDGYALDAAIGVAKSGKGHHERGIVRLKKYHPVWNSATLKQCHLEEGPGPLKQYQHVWSSATLKQCHLEEGPVPLKQCRPVPRPG